MKNYYTKFNIKFLDMKYSRFMVIVSQLPSLRKCDREKSQSVATARLELNLFRPLATVVAAGSRIKVS